MATRVNLLLKTDLLGEGAQELINTWLSLYLHLIRVGQYDHNNVTNKSVPYYIMTSLR